MSSQAITENDLREILNGVLPVAPDITSDSNYIKFPEGTMVCWGITALGASASYARCNFAQSFIDTNYTAIGVIQGSPITATAIGTKNVGFVDINTSTSSYARNISWVAIGKWK